MSAKESNFAPKSLSKPKFLATYPSRTSLTPQRMKTIKNNADSGSVTNNKADKRILKAEIKLDKLYIINKKRIK